MVHCASLRPSLWQWLLNAGKVRSALNCKQPIYHCAIITRTPCARLTANLQASEFNVHGEVVIDCWYNSRDELEKYEESKVMPWCNALLHPVLHDFFHDLGVLARMYGDCRSARQRMW